jgi:cellulose synthase/poly-beta-1,6-N-acetylglucosamine synthase-like glycosyltransferase
LWLLAIYGFALFFYGLWEHAREFFTARRGATMVSVLVVTRDHESVVEGVLRDLVARYGSPPRRRGQAPGDPEGGSYEIVVADDLSSDDTPLILERLARQYPGFVRVAPAPAAASARSAAGGRPAGHSPVERGASFCRGGTVVLIDLREGDDGRIPRPLPLTPRERISTSRREPYQESGA